MLATNNQPTSKNMFPICSAADAFKEQLSSRKRLDGVHADAIVEIERLQPYHLGQDSGKSVLLVLDELTNVNKHRRVLLTQLRASENIEPFIERDGGFWLEPGGVNSVYNADAKFGPYAVIDGKVQMNTKFMAVIAFGEGAANGLEISICLNEWAVYILDKIIPLFERFFA